MSTKSFSGPTLVVSLFLTLAVIKGQDVSSDAGVVQKITTTTTSPPSENVSRAVPQETTSVPTTPEIPIAEDKCPQLSKLPDLDLLTQEEFTEKLTDTCRYDRLIKPITRRPLDVQFQIDMTHVESAEHLMKAHILVQLLYLDSRLQYSHLSPTRGNIVGEESLRDRIWVPHIIVHNERSSALMGLDNKDVFVQISPDGDVTYSYRMTTVFYCWMNLQKFPFDHQICEIRWVSWAYNVTNLRLVWEENKPYQVSQNLHLTEFVVEEIWSETVIVPPSFDRGGLVGNYSGLTFKLKLRREVGYYLLDYFFPSILLVCMSWVTFWLQADAAPARVTLGALFLAVLFRLTGTYLPSSYNEGTANMLTFITLNGGLSKTLPKVSYIKASEIWFFGCASFIFFSLAEFAFVNVIWRRKKKVELKKQNSKHILKGALTPSLARKQLRKAESMNTLYKTRSCSSLVDEQNAMKNTQTNYLTVHSFPSSLNVPTIKTDSHDDLVDNEERVTRIPIPGSGSIGEGSQEQLGWTTMTPQEVAMWIDRKSRVVFPLSFLAFNIFYWSFVYAV